MKIKSIKAKNFFSVGNEPIEIDFTKHGNIILLKGENYDVIKDGMPTSNGSGKSLVSESIVYALYGKTIRNLSHNDIINKKTKKGLEVEICFDNYKVLRTRKPDSLRIWKDNEELTLGGAFANQELLDNIIGLSYNSYLNVCAFGQSNMYDFLSCTPAIKRKIVENLLSLEKYNTFCDIAKEEQKVLSGKIKEQKIYYENLISNKNALANKLDQLKRQNTAWTDKKTKEFNELETVLNIKKKQLSVSDSGNKILLYENAQTEIKELSKSINVGTENKDSLFKLSDTIRDKLSHLLEQETINQNLIKDSESAIKRYTKEISELEKSIGKLNSLDEGAKCSVCYGTISKDNYISVTEHYNHCIQKIKSDIEPHTLELVRRQSDLNLIKSNITKIKDKLQEIKSRQSMIDAKLESIKKKIRELSCIERPDADGDQRLIQDQISTLEDKVFTIKHELNGGNPYKSILSTIDSEINDCENKSELIDVDIKKLIEDSSYYDFWIKGFGDDGIRSLIINDIVPAINDRISYYLYYLMNNKININFNNNLEETITRNPKDSDPFVYNSLSGGEKKKIDLAISQCFGHIISLSYGTCPSVVLFDEIGTYMDESSMYGICEMIKGISQERQVIIITHDKMLLDLLGGYETITIQKKDGVSRIKETIC